MSTLPLKFGYERGQQGERTDRKLIPLSQSTEEVSWAKDDMWSTVGLKNMWIREGRNSNLTTYCFL